MNDTLPNEMIRASAGSGKTWQLTNRYIALMARQHLAGEDPAPERIIAVTFTRKAAGEFFETILQKLAKGCLESSSLVEPADPDSDNARDPAREILSRLSGDDYLRLLRIFIRRMPRLFLGTLDSFFANVLRGFPAEFGLAGDFEIVDDHLAGIARETVLQSVFQRSLPAPGRSPRLDKSRKAFVEAFQQATYGREEARVRSILDEFVDRQHGIFIEASAEKLWGDPGVIWPEGNDWLALGTTGLEKEFARLFEIFESEGVADASMIFWEEFRDQAVEHVPGNAFPTRVGWFFEKLIPCWPELASGEVTLPVNRRKQTLTAAHFPRLERIFAHLVSGELETRSERTHGVWMLLNRYEQAYSRLIRRRGRLTFQDMETILSGRDFSGDRPRPLLSQIPDEAGRLRIDYRLDGHFDHWLLDEFQDTSHVQWAVIENLIDEVLQDTGEVRTLFQVGDTKQAIYAWRGGDTRLFQTILNRYNAHRQRIEERAMAESWRSGADVVEMANRVFGDPAALAAAGVPEDARQRWTWEEHRAAKPNRERPGYAALINPVADASDPAEKQEARFEVVVRLLEEIQPIRNGLSCAVLVQENRHGRALVDYIRAHSPSRIPAMSESDVSVAVDNPATLAILSLFRFAAHPSDEFSRQHLMMTPLAHALPATSGDQKRIASQIRRQIFETGFEQTAREWMDRLQDCSPADSAFTRGRMEDFSLAARIFDRGGSRDIDEFLSYAESYKTREPNTASAVQVMTVHMSKGLTFDCVILPELEGNKLTSVRRGPAVSRNAERQVEWVYELPPAALTRADPVLSRYQAGLESEAAYEQLCKFYVALTRARHANYLIASPRSAASKSDNFVKLLHLTLATGDSVPGAINKLEVEFLYQSSQSHTDRKWYRQVAAERKEERKRKVVAAETVSVAAPAEGRLRPKRRTPSGSEDRALGAAQLFSPEGKRARRHGALVHALFERIEWADDLDPDRCGHLLDALPGADPEAGQAALDEVVRCLRQAETRSALCRPSAGAECWRERRFEILLEGEWLSGMFDRVVLEPGRAATVFDFKTDRIDDEPDALRAKVESYRPQIALYRTVLSRMTGLPADSISGRLLFTKAAKLVEL